MPPRRLLLAWTAGAALPFLALRLFPGTFHGVMAPGSYLVFHNTVEFFSIMVAFSVFGVGWYAFDQSRDRHALFLGTAFLATGLVDFMHTLANAAMPPFITANSTNKSTQFWIAARLLGAAGLLASAFLHPARPRWLTKRALLAAALGVPAIVFVAVTFLPSLLPTTFVPGAGLTTFKVASEYVVIALFVAALLAYWRRMERSGDATLAYYLAAFVVAIFGEAAFASYRTGFDTYNVLGHVYKVAAFYLIYKAAFVASVTKPYVQLSGANEQLRTEIAERQHAEATVRSLNAELEQRVVDRTARLAAANREASRAEEALREANRRKDEFLGMVSHELRNPLAAIRNSVHVIERAEPESAQALRARAIIQRQAEHLTRLVDDLLDVTRIARGKVELRRERVDLRQIVARTADDFRVPIDERGVRLRTELPRDEVWCDADPIRITQIVSNLLHNAAKFTRPGDEVTIALENAGGEARIRVRDTGEGISPSLMPRIFDAFVQGERTLARTDGGLGLGLALVRGVTELHGGRVHVHSGGEGQGAEFDVRLPLAGAPIRKAPRDAHPEGAAARSPEERLRS